MARGDHFFVWRRHLGIPFQHHAIDLGDGTAIHFTDGGEGVAGPSMQTADFEIRRTPIGIVTRDGRDTIHVVEHARKLTADRIVDRALSQVGRRGYDLLFDNCEHFACWCVLDRHESGQVTSACKRAGSAGVKAVIAASVRSVSKVGICSAARGASPWLLVADAAQWVTEAGGHHVGLKDPVRRRRASQAIGGAAALGVGSFGGLIGLTVAGGIWAAGEVFGEASRQTYECLRRQRGQSEATLVAAESTNREARQPIADRSATAYDVGSFAAVRATGSSA